jgi:GAF domain-containing protein
VLGPFQGPVACTRIDKGKGVCGTSWQREEILIVEDVESFPGHIACSALSKSEIVIPVFDAEKKMVAVLDVDSTELKDFDTCDSVHLSSIVSLLHLS